MKKNNKMREDKFTKSLEEDTIAEDYSYVNGKEDGEESMRAKSIKSISEMVDELINKKVNGKEINDGCVIGLLMANWIIRNLK